MDLLREVGSDVLQLVPTAVAVFAVVTVLFAVRYVLERSRQLAEVGRFRGELVLFALTFVGVLVVVLVLPISESLRGQLLALIGIIASAAIALSSTTLLGNALAGLMLRATRSFRMGDFIRVGDHFGRVSDRGLFHVEVQTEFRDLATLPNLYVVTHPVVTIRESGTLIYTAVSLGYDVPRTQVERLMLEAAKECGLNEPFVHVEKLGDFSVTYRVAGLLKDVKHLLSERSRLREAVLDALHRGGVEIVSPSFMNQRVFTPETRFIPELVVEKPKADESTPEAIVFDKAEAAESQETVELTHDEIRDQIADLRQRIKESEDEDEKRELETRRERLESQREHLARIIEMKKSQSEGRD